MNKMTIYNNCDNDEKLITDDDDDDDDDHDDNGDDLEDIDDNVEREG